MIRILWQSPHCLVVWKPAGLATQAPAAHDSLEQRLRAQLSEQPPARPSRYLALPHRLDRGVSGVMLVALSKRAAGLLGQQFETRKIAKSYLAWVHGQVDQDQAQWVDQLRKVPDRPQSEVVRVSEDEAETPPGQQAVTTVRVLQRQPWGSLLELQPLTGRMHQLRIQSAHRGHPILGDALYGSWEAWPAANAADSLALHAWKIDFRDPRDGRSRSVQAPPDWPAERMPQHGQLGP